MCFNEWIEIEAEISAMLLVLYNLIAFYLKCLITYNLIHSNLF